MYDVAKIQYRKISVTHLYAFYISDYHYGRFSRFPWFLWINVFDKNFIEFFFFSLFSFQATRLLNLSKYLYTRDMHIYLHRQMRSVTSKSFIGRHKYVLHTSYIFAYLYLMSIMAKSARARLAKHWTLERNTPDLNMKQFPWSLVARCIDETRIEHVLQCQFNQTFPSVRYQARPLNRRTRLDEMEVRK